MTTDTWLIICFINNYNDSQPKGLILIKISNQGEFMVSSKIEDFFL